MNYIDKKELPRNRSGYAGVIFLKLQEKQGFLLHKCDKCRICLVDKFGIYHGNGGRIRTLSAFGAARRDYNFCEGSNPRLQIKKSFGCCRSSLAAEEGFEPSQTESESGVLPLHNSAKRKDYYTFFFRFVNTFFTRFRCF